MTLKDWEKQQTQWMQEKSQVLEQREKEIAYLTTRVGELESNAKPVIARLATFESEKDKLISQLTSKLASLESDSH